MNLFKSTYLNENILVELCHIFYNRLKIFYTNNKNLNK